IEATQRGGHLLADRGSVLALVDLEVTLEQIDDRQIGNAGAVGFAAPFEVDELLAERAAKFEEEPRFPDPRLAHHGDDPAPAAAPRVDLRRSREHLLRGDGRERRAAWGVLDRLDAERGDEARGTGVLDPSREAFDLLDEDLDAPIEVSARRHLQQRHEALLPPSGGGYRPDGRRRRFDRRRRRGSPARRATRRRRE